MAFDGIVVANLVHELRNELLNGRIAKIAQPETDELLLTIKASAGQRRLLVSASASLPLIVLNRYQQTKSDDSAELLHAAQKTHCERTYRGYLSAKAGANHPLYD